MSLSWLWLGPHREFVISPLCQVLLKYSAFVICAQKFKICLGNFLPPHRYPVFAVTLNTQIALGLLTFLFIS